MIITDCGCFSLQLSKSYWFETFDVIHATVSFPINLKTTGENKMRASCVSAGCLLIYACISRIQRLAASAWPIAAVNKLTQKPGSFRSLHT